MWLVVWIDLGSEIGSVFATRVDGNLRASDGDGGSPIAENDRPAGSIAVAPTAGGYAVSYGREVSAGSDEVDVVDVNRLGVVDESSRMAVGTSLGLVESPTAFATASGQGIVAWSSFSGPRSDVSAAQVDLAGRRREADQPGTLSTTADPQQAPAVAWNGREYLVAWFRTPSSIYAARVGATGAILDGDGLRLTSSAVAGEPGGE